tara:strand:+ start:58 stop:435 length:378 start_codon:yes stop_codon:yes gene_type:complete
MQYGKESIGRKLNRRLARGEITYQTKQRIKMAVTIACELFHCVWQIYGNILYFNQDEDLEVKKCKDKKNPGFEMIMLILLIFGYIFFVIYAVVIALVAALYCRRFNSQRSRMNKSNEILKSISRI